MKIRYLATSFFEWFGDQDNTKSMFFSVTCTELVKIFGLPACQPAAGSSKINIRFVNWQNQRIIRKQNLNE